MMPKGFKSENGYGNSKQLEGKSYKEIAEILNKKGYKIKFSMARTIYIESLMKVANEIAKLYGLKYSREELMQIASNPDFQESVRGFISDADEEKINLSNKSKFSL